MNAAIVLVSVFGIFIPALILPGPDFVAVVRLSMGRGTRAGLLTTVGIAAGHGLYATLSLLGLSALLLQFEWLTWVLRLLGGSYLVFLGIRLLLSKRTDGETATAREARGGNPLLFGFLITLTNPKGIVLFASVFATAVTPATPGWLMALMVGLVMASTLSWYAIVALFMSSSPVARRFDKAKHWIERTAGVCFVIIGGRILADARNPVTP